MVKLIKQFYDRALTVPSQVLLPYAVEEAQIIRTWLAGKREDDLVEILVPHDGLQQELIQMATENAVDTLQSLQAQWQADRHRQETALAELKDVLGMDKLAYSTLLNRPIITYLNNRSIQ